MPESDTTPTSSDLYPIPDEKAAPKVGTPPAHQPSIKNLAGDEELVAKVRSMFQRMYRKYAAQVGRDELEKSMKVADEMYRLSPVAPDDRRKMKTVSNVRDASFLERTDVIHANEMSVLIQGDDLPAIYDIDEQSVGTEFRDEDEARAIVNARQMVEVHTWEKDKRKQKIDDINFSTNKYANGVVSDQWERRVETRKMRKVTARNEEGIPTGFKFVDEEVVLQDCPSLKAHDLKDVLFDTTLDDIRCSAVLEHGPLILNDLYSQQEQGQIMNVGKIRPSHLYNSEPSESNVKDDRHQAADESIPTDEVNGTVDLWHGWLRLPISEKGKWDTTKQLAEMCWVTFAGKVDDASSVCLRILRKPYNHGGHPYHLIHSHPDDKGPVHDGLAEKIKYLSWESQVNLNQYIDGKDLLIRSPMVLQGQVLSGDLKFQSSNKAIRLAFGSTLTKMNIPDASGTTLQMDERLQDKMDKVAQTNKPFLGEALGGRTSATESKNVHDQAIKPGLKKVGYFAEQLFPWLWEMDAALWEQFGDPKRQIRILGAVVDPTELWGPFQVKVSVVTEFANNSLVRQQIGAFLAQNYASAAPEMTAEGRKMLWQSVWKIMELPHGKLIFGMPDVGDALAKAREEAYHILNAGVQQIVEPTMNHQIHIQVKESILEEAQLVLKTDDSEDGQEVAANIPILQQNILQHKQASEQAKQAQAQAQPENQPDAQGLDGNVSGNLIEAEEGAAANAG